MRNRKQEILIKKREKESIDNDFLIQFGWSVILIILTFFIHEASLFNYGAKIGTAMPIFIWVLFGLFVAFSMLSFVLYKRKNKTIHLMFAVNNFLSAIAMYICIGLEKVFYRIPLLAQFANRDKLILSAIILEAVFIPVEIIVYLIRLNKIKVK